MQYFILYCLLYLGTIRSIPPGADIPKPTSERNHVLSVDSQKVDLLHPASVYYLIPKPVSLIPLEGNFIASSILVHADDSLESAKTLLESLWPDSRPETPRVGSVYLTIDTSIHTNPEHYLLEILPESIRLTAPSRIGILHGIQTLTQLISADQDSLRSLPACRIEDYPRFPYRGMHLDVCRHFFPVSFIKKYIDLLAQYKFNTFHWHLTEDQGWRIEIKQYPRLTEVGAWRRGSQIGPFANQKYDTLRYGGFYTQDEIRDVVSYASDRGITVMPEIELPGHALAALTAYPELSCKGGPFEVARGWGVFDDVYCPKEETFVFLENVLTEVMELFPSQFIHIGGDECPKIRWKSCPHCQARMLKEGLKDEHELQSYFIRRIERFVNSKGRKIIGWDEILEGGIAPNAAVMSWRGTEGGIAAARLGHYAVMTPGSHCYFDHYQGDPTFEPLAIGGYTSIQKVYGYEPIPQELTLEESKFILGAQGNVWTEYILNEDHVEYMAVPRMLALSEVLWSPKSHRNESDFLHRLEKEFPRLNQQDVHYAQSLYQVRLVPEPSDFPGRIRVRALAPQKNKPVALSWTIGDKTEYSESNVWIDIDATSDVSARIVPGDFASALEFPVSQKSFRFNKATARTVNLDADPHERYRDGGAFTLVDGITAGDKRINSEWLGWQKSVTITLDLGKLQEINSVNIGALNETHSWIHLPSSIEFLSSPDGKTFTYSGKLKSPAGESTRGGRNSFASEIPLKTRYLRFAIKHPGIIPEGYAGAGYPAWLFLDEISVY